MAARSGLAHGLIVALVAGCGATPSSPALAAIAEVPVRVTFEDISPDAASVIATATCTTADPDTTTGALADLDGDGATEVLLGAARVDDRSTLVFVRGGVGGGLVPSALTLPARFPVLAALDLDDDGHPDLLARERARFVSWNDGHGRFTAPAAIEDPPAGGTAWTAGSVALDDLDDDGWLDVLVAQAACGPDRVGCCLTCRRLHALLRTGPRSWTEHPTIVAEGPPGEVQALLIARLGPGPRCIGAIGWNITPALPAIFYRAEGGPDDESPRYVPFEVVAADAAIFNGRELPDRLGSLVGWSPMGAAAGDLDGDGHPELAVALGPYVATLQGGPAWPLADRTFSTGYASPKGASRGIPPTPWSLAFLDFDGDGRLDVLTVHGNDYQAPGGLSPHCTPQRVTLQHNEGGLRFRAQAVPAFERAGDWRALVVGDLEDDGDPDLVVGGVGEAPRVYRNTSDDGRYGLGLRLHGTTSNALGVGTRVVVTPGGGGPRQYSTAQTLGNALSVSEPRVFVTLPGRAPATIELTWPSGTVQELRGLAPGRVYRIEEPAAIAIDPPSRHVRADGQAVVTLRLTPRSRDGALRRDVRVAAFVLRAGARTPLAVAAGPEGWTATLPATMTPGTARVEVQFDGVAVGVRPRLWWDAR